MGKQPLGIRELLEVKIKCTGRPRLACLQEAPSLEGRWEGLVGVGRLLSKAYEGYHGCFRLCAFGLQLGTLGGSCLLTYHKPEEPWTLA